MKPVDQASLDDCLMASVASVLEVPLENLPVLGPGHKDGSWYDVLQAALRERGFELIYSENRPRFKPHGYHVAGGPSPRGCVGGHAVVCLDGRIVHDPHPSRAGVPDIEHWYMIFPIAGETSDLCVLERSEVRA